MRVLTIAPLAAAVLLIAVAPARSQEIPVLNVDPVFHGIAQQAADPSEKGGPGLAFSQCVQSEQAMRQKLADEWSTFLPAEKTTVSARKWEEWPMSVGSPTMAFRFVPKNSPRRVTERPFVL